MLPNDLFPIRKPFYRIDQEQATASQEDRVIVCVVYLQLVADLNSIANGAIGIRFMTGTDCCGPFLDYSKLRPSIDQNIPISFRIEHM